MTHSATGLLVVTAEMYMTGTPSSSNVELEFKGSAVTLFAGRANTIFSMGSWSFGAI